VLTPVEVEAVVIDWWNRLQKDCQKPSNGKQTATIKVAFNPDFLPALSSACNKIGDLTGVDPLVLRRAFTEIGLRLNCFWTVREKRTRQGKFELERVELSVDLGKLETHTPSGRRQSILPES